MTSATYSQATSSENYWSVETVAKRSGEHWEILVTRRISPVAARGRTENIAEQDLQSMLQGNQSGRGIVDFFLETARGHNGTGASKMPRDPACEGEEPDAILKMMIASSPNSRVLRLYKRRVLSTVEPFRAELFSA